MKVWNDKYMGCQAQDKITHFKGMITSICKYITGCDRILLTPKCGKDGKSSDGNWFDINRLDIIKGKKFEIQARNTGSAKGAMIDPPMK